MRFRVLKESFRCRIDMNINEDYKFEEYVYYSLFIIRSNSAAKGFLVSNVNPPRIARNLTPEKSKDQSK